MSNKTKWVVGTSSIAIASVLAALQGCSSNSDSTPSSTAGAAAVAGAPSAGASSSTAGAPSAGASSSTAGDSSSLAGAASAGASGSSAGDGSIAGTGGASGASSGGGTDSGGSSGSSGAGGTSSAATTFTLQTTGALGQVLATSTGMTLYAYGADTASTTAPVSACTAGCLTTWPLYNGDPASVPDGLSVSDFGTFSNNNATQSTYQGWPLYTYSGDTAPGQANGDQVGAWVAVKIPFTAP